MRHATKIAANFRFCNEPIRECSRNEWQQDLHYQKPSSPAVPGSVCMTKMAHSSNKSNNNASPSPHLFPKQSEKPDQPASGRNDVVWLATCSRRMYVHNWLYHHGKNVQQRPTTYNSWPNHANAPTPCVSASYSCHLRSTGQEPSSHRRFSYVERRE